MKPKKGRKAGVRKKCSRCGFYTYEELNLIHHENMYHKLDSFSVIEDPRPEQFYGEEYK